MDALKDKLETLLKGLFKLKEQQDHFVPAIKPAAVKTPISPTAPGLPKLPAVSNGFTVSKPPAPKPLPGGLAPASKKNPAKVAEQLKNPRPGKVNVEVLKVEDNGQWTLTKGDIDFGPVKGTGESTAPGGAGAMIRQSAKKLALQTPIDPLKHGFKTHDATQHGLIKGLTLHNTVPIGEGRQKAAFATSVAHGDQAVVKNSVLHEDRELRGHVRNNFNSARREVLFHDLAHDFFGMGKHVPTTAGFTLNGEDWSAQKRIFDADKPKYLMNMRGNAVGLVNPNHEKILRDSNKNGTLDKLSIMDHLMGHHDRHGNNFMMDNKGDNLHLIDNGTAFDYGNLDGHPEPGYRKRVRELQLAEPGDHDHTKGFHPEALKWFKKLRPEDAMAHFIAHGHDIDSPAVRGFLGRFLHLKEALKGKFGNKTPDEIFEHGRMKTHQSPKEYV